MDKQSLRGFLAMVERDYPDELVRLREPVKRELDITATVFELERAGRSPVDRGKLGMKRSLLVEGKGIPLGRVLAPASRHDSPAPGPHAGQTRCHRAAPR